MKINLLVVVISIFYGLLYLSPVCILSTFLMCTNSSVPPFVRLSVDVRLLPGAPAGESIVQAVGWRDPFGTRLLRSSPTSSSPIPPSPPPFCCQVGCGHLPGISGMPPDAFCMTHTGFLQHASFRVHVNNARKTMFWLQMAWFFFVLFFFP